MFSIILTIVGLSLFEVISSIDNAIINAQVLHTVSVRARRWFLTWGLLIAVFAVRGLLPWLIVWAVNPSLGPVGSFMASFSHDPLILESIEKSSPILFIGGGTFLLLLFFGWLFLEDKHYGLRGERFIHRHSLWFYTVASALLLVLIWFALKTNPLMAFGAAVGSTVFFLTSGFKAGATELEEGLAVSKRSDLSKLLFLEILDLSFSIDGVLGAFAFTLSVPLILIGNGLGALVVRQITVGNIDRIKKYIYLENGAMYSIFFLGCFMVLESFGAQLPKFIPPVLTISTIGFFFWKSVQHLKSQSNQ